MCQRHASGPSCTAAAHPGISKQPAPRATGSPGVSEHVAHITARPSWGAASGRPSAREQSVSGQSKQAVAGPMTTKSCKSGRRFQIQLGLTKKSVNGSFVVYKNS